MAVSIPLLRIELLGDATHQADPMNLGYAALVVIGAHNAVADLMNTARAGYTVNTYQISGDKLFKCIVYSEIPASNTRAYSYLEMACVQKVVDLSDVAAPDGGAQVRAGLATLFPSNTATYANVFAAQRRDGSRSEVLFGAGTRVSAADISAALAG